VEQEISSLVILICRGTSGDDREHSREYSHRRMRSRVSHYSAHPSLQPRSLPALRINGAAVIAGASRLPRHASALDLIIAGRARNSHSRQIAADSVIWPAIGRSERASRWTSRASPVLAWDSAGIHENPFRFPVLSTFFRLVFA